jgi:hypothetical protein
MNATDMTTQKTILMISSKLLQFKAIASFELSKDLKVIFRVFVTFYVRVEDDFEETHLWCVLAIKGVF